MSKLYFKNTLNSDKFKFKLSESGSTYYISHISTFGHYTKCSQINFATKLMQELLEAGWYLCDEYKDKLNQ